MAVQKFLSAIFLVFSWFTTIASAGGLDTTKFKLSEKEYIIPKGFGNYTQDSLSTASSCGTIMSTYNGISAYSNGDYQGTGNSCGGSGSTGYKYQVCDNNTNFSV